MSRWKVLLLAVLAAPLVAFGVVTACWVALGPDDERVKVAPNVSLAGSDVSGKSAAALDDSLERLSDRFGATPIEIQAPDFTIRTTASELGLSIDTGSTKAATLDVGRSDPGPLAPLRWLKSFAADRRAPLALHIDRVRASHVITTAEATRRTAPTEPALALGAKTVGMTPGAPGHALDIDGIVDKVPAAVGKVGRTITIRVEQQEVQPKLRDEDVQAVADRANAVSSHPLTIRYDRHATTVKGADFRPGFRLDTSGAKPTLGLDAKFVADLITAKLKVPANPTGVHFDIVGGTPTPIAGHDADVCCDANAPATLVSALLAGKSEVTFGTRNVTAAEGVEWAKTLGVHEVVGQFTTNHPCCAARVTNIHKMADITRGALIAPGETFSANAFVGKRTPEKGFVSAPVIDEGQYSEDFGGGVSQWATTTFNAAFFAGLDIPQHKAHSIYISRYPFGREATLAYPSVDLKIHNNTPYGVVIYPTYTGTSITVQLWSTKFAVGTQSAIDKTSGCGPVVVTRSRTFVDGHSATDKFRANYNCNPPKHP